MVHLLLPQDTGIFVVVVYVVYHIDLFVGIEKSLHPWDKFYLIMVYYPFNVSLDLVC